MRAALNQRLLLRGSLKLGSGRYVVVVGVWEGCDAVRHCLACTTAIELTDR
jgi:hypothetical protein